MKELNKIEITLEEATRLLKLDQEVVVKKCEEGELDYRISENEWLLDKEKVLKDINEHVLWYKGDEKFYIVNENDITENIYLDTPTMTIDAVDIEQADTSDLMKKLKDYEGTYPEFCVDDTDDMEEFFESIGYKNVSVDYAEELMPVEGMLFYDIESGEFLEGFDIDGVKMKS